MQIDTLRQNTFHMSVVKMPCKRNILPVSRTVTSSVQECLPRHIN